MNVYVYGQTPKTTNKDPQLLYFPEGDELSHIEAKNLWQKIRSFVGFTGGRTCCTLPSNKKEETWMHIQFYSSGLDGTRDASFFILLLLSKQEMEDCKWSPWYLKDSTGFFVARDRWIALDAPKTYAQPFAVENTENTENTDEEFSKRVRISKDLIHNRAKKIFFWENEQDISKEAFSALCIQNPSQAASYSLLQCKMNNNFPSASFAAPFGMLCGGTKPNEIQKDGVLFEWAAIKTDTTAHQTNPRLTALPSKPSTTTSHHAIHKETTLQQNSTSPNNTTTQQSAPNSKEQRAEPSKSQPNSSSVPLHTETTTNEDATSNPSIKELFSRQSTYLWLSTFCLLSFNVYLFTQQTSLKSKISQQENSQIKSMLSNKLFKKNLSESISGALKTEKVYASRTIADAFQTTVQNIKANADEIKGNTKKINTNTGEISENTKKINTNTGEISENTKKISENTKKINTNTGEISENTKKISENTKKINTNTGEISENTKKISENTKKINTNTGEISENTKKINTNTGEISENTKKISENADNISKNRALLNDLTGLVGKKTDTAQANGSLYARNAFLTNKLARNDKTIKALIDNLLGLNLDVKQEFKNIDGIRTAVSEMQTKFSKMRIKLSEIMNLFQLKKPIKSKTFEAQKFNERKRRLKRIQKAISN